jgi:hypothetical protein
MLMRGLHPPLGAAKLRRRQDPCEVEQRALRRGHGDPLVMRDVSPVQRAGAMDSDPFDASRLRGDDRHVGQPLLPRQVLQEHSDREPAQVRVVSAGEDGGHEAPLARHAGVPYRIHAAVHAMQRSVTGPRGDGIGPEPAVAQLLRGDLPLLPSGLPRDEHVGGWRRLIPLGGVDGSTPSACRDACDRTTRIYDKSAVEAPRERAASVVARRYLTIGPRPAAVGGRAPPPLIDGSRTHRWQRDYRVPLRPVAPAVLPRFDLLHLRYEVGIGVFEFGQALDGRCTAVHEGRRPQQRWDRRRRRRTHALGAR